MNKEQLDKDLHTIASEIEGFLLSGKATAVGAVIVTDDGQAHIRFRYIPGGRLILLAGLNLMNADLIKLIQDDVGGKHV